MRLVLFLLCVLVFGSVQAALVNRVGLWGITPDFFSALTAAGAVALGPLQCVAVGLAAGFFKDIFDVLPFGMNLLLLPCLAYALYRLNRQLSLDNRILCAVFSAIGVSVCTLIGGSVLIYYGADLPAGILLRNAVSAAVLTGLVVPLMSSIRFLR